MATRKVLLLTTILPAAVLTVYPFLSTQSSWAQSPTYGFGKTPTAEEIRAWDIAISPDGHELPQGHGTAKEGAALYTKKGCAGCHGATGSGGRAPTLIEVKGAPPMPPMPGMDMMGIEPPGLMATHAPFATVMWDYISKAMPINREGTLTPDEVYSLTAYILFKNGVIKEDDVLDKKSLSSLKMPGRAGFTPIPEWKHATPRLLNYP